MFGPVDGTGRTRKLKMMKATKVLIPPTEIENARAVLARSIDCVKRTDSTASRAILVLFATGRKRTTDGAVVVWTANAA